MDRGYIDREGPAHLDYAGSFFVTRTKSNLKAPPLLTPGRFVQLASSAIRLLS